MRSALTIGLLLGLCFCGIGEAQYAAPESPQAPAPAGEPVACPWLTQGTAAAALGGDVSVTAAVSESGEGVCKFVRRQGPADRLEIVVKKGTLPACPQGSVQLKGIGNRAELCTRAGVPNEKIQMLSSRVRDQYFTLTLFSYVSETDDPPPLREQPLENIGEQVAGNLY